MGKLPNQGDGLTSARIRKASGVAFGPILRLLGFTGVGCLAAGAAISMYPHEGNTARTAVASTAPAEAPRAATVPSRRPPEAVPSSQLQPASAQPASLRVNAGAQSSGADSTAGRRVALASQAPPAEALPAAALPLASVEAQKAAAAPEPPIAPAAPSPPPTALPPAPSGKAVPSAVASSTKTPTNCLPADFLGVIREVEARFGAVTLVSTTSLNTNNHGTGSARHKLHTDCRAIDFKVAGDTAAVTAFLRSRPEVQGINVFRNNGMIHIDYKESRRAARD